MDKKNPAGTEDDDGDVDMKLGDLDSEFEKLSDDEPPIARQRRHKRPRVDDWAKEIIQKRQCYTGVYQYGLKSDTVRLQSPAFSIRL